MAQRGKFGVAHHALVRRVGRALARKGEKLYFQKSPQVKGFEQGGYAIVSIARGVATDPGPVDLEELARKLDVLEECEYLSE